MWLTLSCSLAGVSRSVTLVIAYIMTVTDFGWEDALHTVRAGRSCANPNLGFQRQLQEFEKHEVHQVSSLWENFSGVDSHTGPCFHFKNCGTWNWKAHTSPWVQDSPCIPQRVLPPLCSCTVATDLGLCCLVVPGTPYQLVSLSDSELQTLSLPGFLPGFF
jgi:hypothetical protein